MDFVAIDVETANADMASICQIGIATFVSGALAGEWKTYVDPQDDFDGLNVSIHGIDSKVVAGSPTFGMLADTVIGALNGRVVVTHTAFDKVAIYQAATNARPLRPLVHGSIRRALCAELGRNSPQADMGWPVFVIR